MRLPYRSQLPLAFFASVVTLTSMGGEGFAQQDLDPVCHEQAGQLVERVPNIGKTGIKSGPDLIADERGRWGLAASFFGYATNQFASNAGNAYWSQILVLSDGLLRCFEADRSLPQYSEVAPQFDARFPKERRTQIVAAALYQVANGDQ